MRYGLLAVLSILLSSTPLTAQTARYQVDDGSFEGRVTFAVDDDGLTESFEVAQQVRIAPRGRLTSATACAWRESDDPYDQMVFWFDLYRDDDGRPGEAVNHPEHAPFVFEEIEAGAYTCLTAELDFGFEPRIDADGLVWVGAHWLANTTVEVTAGGIVEPLQRGLAADWNGPGNTILMSRIITAAADTGEQVTTKWEPVDPKVRAVGIRFEIDSGPDPVVRSHPPSGEEYTRYQADDGSFEGNPSGVIPYWQDENLRDPGRAPYEAQVAQRFDIAEKAYVRWFEACFERLAEDDYPNLALGFLVYDTHVLQGYELPSEPVLPKGRREQRLLTRIPRGEVTCVRKDVDFEWEIDPQRSLDKVGGAFWVAVRFFRLNGSVATTGKSDALPKLLRVDYDSPDYTRSANGVDQVRVSSRSRAGRLVTFGSFAPEHPDVTHQAAALRIGIEHGAYTGSDPDLPEPPTGDGYTGCVPTAASLAFAGGYEVRMCYETPAGEIGEGKAGIWASDQSGLLWFFDRDNAEVLIKVLDGCSYNQHRWVFVAPVTDVAFNLYVSDGEGRHWSHHNKLGETAVARADTMAFPCAASSAADDRIVGPAGPREDVRTTAVRLGATDGDGYTDCVPTTAPLVFDGYEVRMCYETPAGEIGEGKAGIWASGQSGLLWFFDRGNAEVLIKVLDGCSYNERRWVFVAPVTDLAFNLEVRDPAGGPSWTHRNPQGQTASTRRDTQAFACN